MRKKTIFVFGIVFLMLVSTEIFFVETTKSDPTAHDGNAYVGGFWLEDVDITGIDEGPYDQNCHPHVIAQDDWIFYSNNSNIVANWSIDIGAYHCFFNITFILEVRQVYPSAKYGGSINIFNDHYAMNCSANTSYNISGNLSVSLQNYELEDNNLTLVALLTAFTRSQYFNNGKNLTLMAEDRSIIAVEDPFGSESPFSYYVNFANYWLPPPWHVVPGSINNGYWQNNETLFLVGGGGFCPVGSGGGEPNPMWTLANVNFKCTPDFKVNITGFSEGETEKTWEAEYGLGVVSGPARVTFTAVRTVWPIRRPALLGFWLVADEGYDGFAFGLGFYPAYLVPVEYNSYIWGFAEGWFPEDTNDSYSIPMNGNVYVGGDHRNLTDYTLNVNIVEEEQSAYSSGWGWISNVAYFVNNSYDVGVSSVTMKECTIAKANIKDFFENMADHGLLYTYSADSGTKNVQFYVSD